METQLAELQQQILSTTPPHSFSSHHHHQAFSDSLSSALPDSIAFSSLLSARNLPDSTSYLPPNFSSLTHNSTSPTTVCLGSLPVNVSSPQAPLLASSIPLTQPSILDDQCTVGDPNLVNQSLDFDTDLDSLDLAEQQPLTESSPQRSQPLSADAIDNSFAHIHALVGDQIRGQSHDPQGNKRVTARSSSHSPSTNLADTPGGPSVPLSFASHNKQSGVPYPGVESTSKPVEVCFSVEQASGVAGLPLQEAALSPNKDIVRCILPLKTSKASASSFSDKEVKPLATDGKLLAILRPDSVAKIGDSEELNHLNPDSLCSLSSQIPRSPSLSSKFSNQLVLLNQNSAPDSKTYSTNKEEGISLQQLIQPHEVLTAKLHSDPSRRPLLLSEAHCDTASQGNSPPLVRCSSLRELGKKTSKKAPLSSSSRCRALFTGSLSSATSEVEHGFTTEEDTDRAPLMTGQTIQSMAGAPIPAVYDLLHQSQAVEESPTSAPLDAAPSAHSPTTLAPLSDENLQRQALAPKERVRRSVKMRDTERWAIQTATTSRQASSPGGSHSEGVHVSEVEVQSGTSRSAPASPAELAALNVATCEASPVISNHPSEPRQTLTVLPVPHARAVPVLESGVGSLIASEVASVNDWLSENTTNVGLNQSSRNIPMPSFSPTDVQVVGLTPTSAERMSFSPRGRFFIQPGTLIGSDRAENDSNDLKGTIVDQVSSFSTFTPNQQSSPKIEELHGTPTGRSISNLSDPLIRARLSLQEAFSTTPQARASSSSSKSLTPSPARTTSRTVLEPPAYSDHDSEDDSGLSEIKEDRTAELAAEHSWKLRRDRLAAAINKELRSPIESNVTSIAGERADEVSTPTPRVLDLPRVAQTSPAASHSSPVLATDAKPSPNYSSGIQPLANPQFHPHTDSVAISPQEPELSTGSLHEISSVNESTGISDTTGNVFGADRRKDDIISPQLAQKASSFSKKEQPSRVLSDSEPVANRQQVLPLSVRAGPLHKPNPPLSIPANARRPLPSDLLSRLEMEEWRDQTGVDDRHGLFLRASGSNCEVESRVIGLGGEERRGMKDRWGNSWGLESHVLSPLSEHTERSLTTAASCISLSTLQSVHSLRSMESPSSNSLAQRLNQAELNSARMAKLGSGIARASMLRSASSPTGSPGSLSKINDNSHQQYLETTDPHVLLEEKMKRKEARRIKREKREKRRVEELKRCESLAEKQERRRKERKKKEEFLERKQILLQKLQEDPENPTFVRDLGILYLSCNAGAAGLKIAIKHLETSLQMCDSDPVAWSSLGKAWAQLHDMPDEELAKLGDRQDTDRKQQAHNATIGLRKAILNSRSTAEALKFKVEWARYLEKSGRWRDSLGVIGEVIGNEGKMDPHCWASLGFIGLRVVFGWEPLKTLETDVLRQGILDDQASENNSDRHRFQDLCDSDRLKLLVQVRHAFERALELLMGEIDLSPECAAQRQETQKYRDHYLNQLQKVKKTEEEMRKQQSFVTETVGSGEVCHQGNGDDSKLINSHSFTEAISTSAVTNFHSDESKVEDESKPVLSELTGSASRLDKKSNISAKHQSSESRREDLSMTISEGDLLKQIADPEPTQYNRRGISMASLDENSTQEQEEKNVAKPLTIQSGPIEDFRSHAQSPVPQSNRSLLLSQLPQDSLPTKNTSQVMILGNSLPPPFMDPEMGSDSEYALQYDDVDTTNEFTDERMVEISRVPTGLNQHFSHHQQPSSDVRQEHSLSCPLPVFNRPSSVADFSQIHREVHQATADSMAGNLSPQQIFRAACYTSAPPDSASGESVEAACTDQREYFTPNSASALPPSSSALVRSNEDFQPLPVLETKPSADSSIKQMSRYASPPHPTQDACPPLRRSSFSQSMSSLLTIGAGTKAIQPLQLESQFQILPTNDQVEVSSVNDHRRGVELSLSRQDSNHELSHNPSTQQYDLYRDKVKAFIELDNSFYNKSSLLRKRLVEVEEEHGRRRREMIEELGLNEILRSEVLTEEESQPDRSSKGGFGFSQRNYSSPNVSSPTHDQPFLHSSRDSKETKHRLVEHKERAGSRNQISQLQPPRALVNDCFENREEVNSSVTLQGSPIVRSGEVGQANIALQGIAAILRLASTSAGTASTTAY